MYRYGNKEHKKHPQCFLKTVVKCQFYKNEPFEGFQLFVWSHQIRSGPNSSLFLSFCNSATNKYTHFFFLIPLHIELSFSLRFYYNDELQIEFNFGFTALIFIEIMGLHQRLEMKMEIHNEKMYFLKFVLQLASNLLSLFHHGQPFYRWCNQSWFSFSTLTLLAHF